ncbi:MAG: hypothetical protein C0404_14680 [Verrucomicrobia bacterium]|nr:hypothetical protein [Verrucomicrobiota bacterium]
MKMSLPELFTVYCSLFTRQMILAVVAILLCFIGVCRAEDDPEVGGKPLSELVKQLRSENRGLQMRAAQALCAAPTNMHVRIVPQVLPILKSERENDKFVAAQVLGAYGVVSKAAIPDLLPMLKGTQYERNRAAAAKTLGQILQDAKPSDEVENVTQELMKVFRDPYADVQRESVYACGMIGPAAKSCIPKLQEPLEYGIPNSNSDAPFFLVRQATAWTISRMGPLAEGYMDRLIARLHHEGVKMPAIVEAIGSIGPVNDKVVPNIYDFMEKGAAWWMVEPWQVLQKFGVKAEQVIPFAKRFLTNPQFYGMNDRRQRELTVIEALKFLQVAGPKAVDVLPQVESLIDYKYPHNAEDDLSPLMRKEAAKTAGILKGAKN